MGMEDGEGGTSQSAHCPARWTDVDSGAFFLE